MTLLRDTYLEQLANEQMARQLAESNATSAAAANSVLNSTLSDHQIRLIPKPLGSAGDCYCLIEEMGLVNNKPSYNAIVVHHH